MTIHQYATEGDCEGVRKELRNGVFVDARDERDNTPLACAANSPNAHADTLLLLIEAGADVDAMVDEFKQTVDMLKSLNQFDQAKFKISEWRRTPLELAASSGNLLKVQILLDAGANPNLVLTSGRTAMFSAISALWNDEKLIPMIEVFVKHGSELDRTADNTETPLTVASEIGRFDAVKYLIEAGADSTSLGWTPLMSAVAMGSCEDVKTLIRERFEIDKKDRFGRTTLHLAATIGDVEKAELLHAIGCEIDAMDRGGDTALMIAAMLGKTEMVRWLIDQGSNVESRGRTGDTALANCVSEGHVETARRLIQTGADVNNADDCGNTPLIVAAQAGQDACVRLLLYAGADQTCKNTWNESALSTASSVKVIRQLVKAGEDLTDISKEMKRALTRMDGVETLNVSKAQYLSGRYRRFGQSNPEEMNIPFWREMARAGINAYQGKKQFNDTSCYDPVWCFDRFGTSFTELPDGRIVQIAGEHEDYYDSDFCIYNDVFVHERSGEFKIYGYPKEVFPPTDFHTATYFNDCVYIVGGLGYQGERHFGMTPVYRLNSRTWKIEAVPSFGENPGWIFKHRASVSKSGVIVIAGGTICQEVDGEERNVKIENGHKFCLDLSDMKWSRIQGEPP